MLSPHLTVEEAYLLCKYVRGIDPQAVLALGPVPVVGEDETFPERLHDPRRKMPQPQRRGRSRRALLRRQIMTFDELLGRSDDGEDQGGLGQRRLSSTRLERRGDGRAIRRRWNCWSCKICSPRRCGAWRPISCPAPALPSAKARTSITPIGCNRSTGRFGRRPGCGSKGNCIGRLLGTPRLVQRPRGAGRNRSRDHLRFAAAAGRGSARGNRFESESIGRTAAELRASFASESANG